MLKTVADWGKRGRRNRMSGWCILAWAAVGWAAVCGAAVGQCQYEIVQPFPIQGPNCWLIGPQPTYPAGLNSHGWVVGYYWDCWESEVDHAFLWKPGVGLETLPTPPGVTRARATGINDDGFVIGEHRFPFVGWKAFVYNPHTQTYTHLEALHGDIGPTQTVSSATSINNDLVITGSRIISAPGESLTRNAVVWMPFGKGGEGEPSVIDLGVGDGPNSGASWGNDAGDVAGWTGTTQTAQNSQAVMWSDGNLIPLGFLRGDTSSNAVGLNKHQQVIGVSRSGPFESFRGFLWDKGVMVELVAPPEYVLFSPRMITDGGTILGSLVSEPASHNSAFRINGEFYRLTDLITSLPSGLSVQTPRGVNKHGSVASAGHLAGKQIGVLMSPIGMPTGDFNFDCEVGVDDLLYLLNEWGQPDSIADLSGNGAVGVPDLLILLANWG